MPQLSANRSLLVERCTLCLIGPHILEKLLYQSPQQMVNFKVYKREQVGEEDESSVDRRLTRIKNQNYLPLGVWAKWVGESIPFPPPCISCIMLYDAVM